MKIHLTTLFFCFSLIVSASSMGREKVQFSSGEAQVQVIELFTSEGCSSCPPADRWLSSLKNQDGLWTHFIPLAFHVDYWDYIGWQDPFARREFSQRQRRYAAEFSESTVYTPGVRRNGQEWRRWRGSNDVLKGPSTAVGNLSFEVLPERRFQANFKPLKGSSNSIASSVQLSVALLGNNIESQVTRGENRGKLLEHDFVVLILATYAGQEQNGAYTWQGVLPEAKPTSDVTHALAAWVTRGNSLQSLQAVGGYLPD